MCKEYSETGWQDQPSPVLSLAEKGPAEVGTQIPERARRSLKCRKDSPVSKSGRVTPRERHI